MGVIELAGIGSVKLPLVFIAESLFQLIPYSAEHCDLLNFRIIVLAQGIRKSSVEGLTA